MKFNPKFIYTFLRNSPAGQTTRRIFTLDGSNDADSCKGMPFWLSLILQYCSPFRGQIAQKPQFGGMNRRYPAKCAEYRIVRIIETTLSIITKFCTVIETIKYILCEVQIFPKRIQDNGGCRLENKSQYLYNGLTDFDKIWHSDASRPSESRQPIKFRIFENLRWKTAAIFKNKNSISQHRIHQFLTNLAQ